MPTASPLCLAGDAPPLPLGEPRTQLLSSLLKTKHQTTKGEKSSDGDEEAREAAQEVAPAASCRITNKTASRHLARDVTCMSLAVGGGDSRRDLRRRGNIKRVRGVVGADRANVPDDT